MKSRISEVKRKTLETDIEIKINLDGKGIAELKTNIPFLNHMLNLFARHGMFDLAISATGDTEIDAHHTVEDIGICLGMAVKKALQDKKGINRYGFFILPMDEVLVRVALDLSGRGQLFYRVNYNTDRVGTFELNLIEEFFQAFSYHSGTTLHINLLEGKNPHHMVEAVFKAFGRALGKACALDEQNQGIPSTKGVLE